MYINFQKNLPNESVITVRTSNLNFKFLTKSTLKLSKVVRYVVSKNFTH